MIKIEGVEVFTVTVFPEGFGSKPECLFFNVRQWDLYCIIIEINL